MSPKMGGVRESVRRDVPGPEGPRRTLPRTPPIFGDTLGDTPGTLRARRARETPVAGRRDRNTKNTIGSFGWAGQKLRDLTNRFGQMPDDPPDPERSAGFDQTLWKPSCFAETVGRECGLRGTRRWC